MDVETVVFTKGPYTQDNAVPPNVTPELVRMSFAKDEVVRIPEVNVTAPLVVTFELQVAPEALLISTFPQSLPVPLRD